MFVTRDTSPLHGINVEHVRIHQNVYATITSSAVTNIILC